MNYLKELRAIKGYSQYMLAKKSGVTVHTIIHCEKENANPTLNTIKKIAKGLGIKTHELVRLEATSDIIDFKNEFRNINI